MQTSIFCSNKNSVLNQLRKQINYWLRLSWQAQVNQLNLTFIMRLKLNLSSVHGSLNVCRIVNINLTKQMLHKFNLILEKFRKIRKNWSVTTFKKIVNLILLLVGFKYYFKKPLFTCENKFVLTQTFLLTTCNYWSLIDDICDRLLSPMDWCPRIGLMFSMNWKMTLEPVLLPLERCLSRLNSERLGLKFRMEPSSFFQLFLSSRQELELPKSKRD